MTHNCILLGLLLSTPLFAADPVKEMPQLRAIGAYTYHPHAPEIAGGPTFCRFSVGERHEVLKQGALLELLKNRRITGLALYAGLHESRLFLHCYHRFEVKDGALADIGKLTHLEYLELGTVDLSGKDGMQFLANLRNLKHLQLLNCNVELKDVLAAIPAYQHLEYFRISNRNGNYPEEKGRLPPPKTVVAKEIKRLVTSSPRLEDIFLMTNELYRPEAVAEFANLESLNSLHLRSVKGDMKDPTGDQAEAQRNLERLFQKKGMSRWRVKGWDKTYTIYKRQLNVTGD